MKLITLIQRIILYFCILLLCLNGTVNADNNVLEKIFNALEKATSSNSPGRNSKDKIRKSKNSVPTSSAASSVPTEKEPKHTFGKPGTYKITLYAATKYDYKYQKTKTIKVINKEEFSSRVTKQVYAGDKIQFKNNIDGESLDAESYCNRGVAYERACL